MSTDRNDPTQSGFIHTATGPIRLSCNEVGALCLKAARGAGFSWGLAEEAGYAARWLYEHAVDGPTALADFLDARAGIMPVVTLKDGIFRTSSGDALCPISAGAGMSDVAGSSSGPWLAKEVCAPILLLPFVAQVATSAQVSHRVKWSRGAVIVSAGGSISGDVSVLATTKVADVLVEAAPEVTPTSPDIGKCPAVPSETLSRLDAYAMKTTVPPSDASRSDAGATGGDND